VSPEDARLGVTIGDLVAFIDQALDALGAVVEGLGDELVNRRPDLPGANSPFALATHCAGVMEFWAGHVIAGRTVERDRDAEFEAAGPAADAVAALERARRQLHIDLAGFASAQAPRRPLPPVDAALPLGRSQGGALLHVYEELAQHLGQLEVTRDILRAGAEAAG
jgi:hypothetical protein